MTRVQDLVEVGFNPIQAKHLGVISNGAEGNFDALSAAGNNSQANAYQLIANYNRFTTVTAGSADSVKLPLAISDPNGLYIVQNAGAASINLFPATGDNFLGLAANTKMTVPTGCTANIVKQSNTSWLVQIVLSNSQSALTTWTDYTPSYSASGSMTFGTVTTTTAKYCRIGNVCFVRLDFSGTTGGTASNQIIASAPIAPVGTQNGNIAAVRDATSGVVTTGFIQVNNATGFSYFNSGVTNWGLGAGRICRSNIFYEVV